MEDVAARLHDAASKLEDLRVLLEEEEDLERMLRRLTETATRAVPAASTASVTVMVDEGRTAWSSTAADEMVLAMDEVQYATGHGPCLEAARTLRPIRVGIEEARDRWPAFADVADRAGMRSYLSAPLSLGDEPVLGALNMYGRAADAFDSIDEALLRFFTAATSAAIISTRRYRRARDRVLQMRTAMQSRAEIEQAKGVLMAQQAITADEAFEQLVHRSQDTNTKLREVARSLLNSLHDSTPSA